MFTDLLDTENLRKVIKCMKENKRPNVIPFRDPHMAIPEEDHEMNEEHRAFIDHLMELRMRDMMMSDEERTSPDTYGCDSMFLESFITPEMEEDFSLIARDFLLHEYGNIKDHEMIRYLDTDPSFSWPDRIFERYILNLMMNAVNAGSTYTRDLFVYLHKTYYRKEYQVLKRFNNLSADELLSIARNDNGGIPSHAFARILAISRMYGINISPDCNFIYMYLNDIADNDEVDLDWDYMKEIEDSYEECRKEIDQIFESRDEMIELYYDNDNFLANVFMSEGYAEDYAMLCNDQDHGIEDRLARTLAVLKTSFEDREYTKKELATYASIYEAASALMCSAVATHNRLDEVLYGERGLMDPEMFPSMFKPDNVKSVRVEPAKTAKGGKDKKTQDKEESGSPKYKEETLLAEIDALHRQLHLKDAEIKELKGKASGNRKLAEDNEKLKEQLESERRELAAIRQHLYNMTEADEVGENVSLDEMKDFLKEHRVIIIGGHSNWRQKMKQEFPDWVYIDATVSGSLESNVVDKADHVYFFTDTISHSTYFKYINVVREHDVKFGYIHGVNIENNIRKMYKELKDG